MLSFFLFQENLNDLALIIDRMISLTDELTAERVKYTQVSLNVHVYTV